MDVRATSKHLRQAPRKMRQVLDTVRGKRVNDALTSLSFMNKKAAFFIHKTLKSAVANMQDRNDSFNDEKLYIKEAFVNEGPPMKRWRAAAMGRGVPIRKRTSHLTIVISDNGK